MHTKFCCVETSVGERCRYFDETL